MDNFNKLRKVISFGKRGGYRGGGRPKGVKNKIQIKDHFSKKEINELIKKAKELAKNGDKEMIKFLTEHIYGKPTIREELSGKDGGEIVINQVVYNGDKNTPQIHAKTLPIAPAPSVSE